MSGSQNEQQVLAEIARLERAIQDHKDGADAQGPSARASARRGRGRGAGARGRGRGGRGGAPRPSYRNTTWVAPVKDQEQASASADRGDGAADRARRDLSSSPESSTKTSLPPRNPEQDAPMAASSSSTEVAEAPKATALPAAPRQVVIGGVTFVADARGNKLVRKSSQETSSAPPASASATSNAEEGPPNAGPSSLTPRRMSHLGTTYIRTKTGNLVSLAFARKQKEIADARKARAEEFDAKRERLDKLVGVVKDVQGARNAAQGGRGRGRGGFAKNARPRRAPKPKSDKLCRFFQRTGQCTRAHTCPYVHDSNKIAICPLFLRSSCLRTAAQCPLSHSPNAHRSPHCVYFPLCSRGPACPYAHVGVPSDAVPCRDFVELGWCERGEECDKRHVRECWRFAETGKCEQVGCKEPHVLRRTHTAEEEDEDGDGTTSESDSADGGSSRRPRRNELDEEVDDMVEDAVEHVEAERVFGQPGGGRPGAVAKKRMRRDSDTPGLVGISGAAGRRLKRIKDQEEQEAAAAKKSHFVGLDDYIPLAVPLTDVEDDEEEGDEDEEEEDGSSVDSEDLEESEAEKEVSDLLLAPTAQRSRAGSPAPPQAVRPFDEDALDYD